MEDVCPFPVSHTYNLSTDTDGCEFQVPSKVRMFLQLTPGGHLDQEVTWMMETLHSLPRIQHWPQNISLKVKTDQLLQL